MVVDDDRDVRQLAVSCLESLGYQVVAADGGQAAVDLAASDARIDMVLIDIAMPEITGVEVMEAILKKASWHSILVHDGLCGADQARPFRTPCPQEAFHNR